MKTHSTICDLVFSPNFQTIPYSTSDVDDVTVGSFSFIGLVS